MKSLRKSIRFFLEDVKGSLSVEAALAFPMLVWVFSAMFVYWDAFKMQNNNLKATYTIADLLSRETLPITQNYLNGVDRLFTYMTVSNHDAKIRVSVISKKLKPDGTTTFLNLEWSHSTDGLAVANTAADLESVVPVMAVGDQLIVVETLMVYEPVLSVGLPADIYGNVVVVRPRFVPQVLWQS